MSGDMLKIEEREQNTRTEKGQQSTTQTRPQKRENGSQGDRVGDWWQYSKLNSWQRKWMEEIKIFPQTEQEIERKKMNSASHHLTVSSSAFTVKELHSEGQSLL